MTKDKFEIGEAEKHLFVVDWDRFMKHITIELDGEKVVDEFHYTPTAKKFQFDVGSSEKHHVEITAGIFSHKLVVDGKAAQKT
jgi:hypothetical protein